MMMMMISVLLLLLLVCVSSSYAATKSVYVCPSDIFCEGMRSYQLPSSNVFVKSEMECEKCKQISFAAEASVYILRIKQDRAALLLPKLVLLATVLSVTPIEGEFYLIAVEEDGLDEFERFTVKIERQKVNFMARYIKKGEKSNTLHLAEREMMKNAEKDDIMADFIEADYGKLLRQLSGNESLTVDSGTYTIQTRHSSTSQNKVAAEFILEFLDNLGYEAYYQYFRCQSGYDTQNIIGVKQGGSASDEIVVVGGHMDSTSPSTSNAPGAIDNASGAVAMMQIARAFQNISLARTVHFMGFGCEEQGLIGSEYYCENSRDNIVAAITMDMIAYSNRYYGVMIEGLPDPDVQNLMNLMKSNCAEYSPELSTTSRNFSFGSDHVSFQSCGIPAFLAIERDETDYVCYHQTCDRYNYSNDAMANDIARAAGGVLYDIAKEI